MHVRFTAVLFKSASKWALTFASLILASAAFASDWPQYRGPSHDGSSPESGIVKNWPKSGPKVLWKVPTGAGFAAISVSNDQAFCFIDRDAQEVCISFDAGNGKDLWSHSVDKSIVDRQGGNGPRSTPAIDGDNVYVLGTYLKLLCLKKSDGSVVWQHDLKKEFAGQIIGWGSAASPLIDGNLIFACAGGGNGQSLLAFDKKTGQLVWKAEDDKLTHATPVPATIHGVRQIIFFTQSGLVSVVPESGKVLWRYGFPHSTSTAASPIVGGDIVYCAAAYGVGAGACKVSKTDDGFSAAEIWRNSGGKMQNHWTTPVYRDGYLYGLYKEPSSLRCIEMATGKEMWSQRGFAWQGATVLVEGHVLVQDDKGALVLVEATPKSFHEVARTQALAGKCWTMPAISNGHVFARSDKEMVCLDLSGK
jgi:outer membrane protein assembly factor BamB